MNYEEAVEYILDIPKFTKKNPMENIRALMVELGNPQNNMKVIHVAGTNGKGSVCAYISSILECAGKANAMFTSPHLVDINERFMINGIKIDNEIFIDTFNQVKKAIDLIIEKGFTHPTFFETLFAMAMVVFDHAKVEYTILETGIGGRLDATNMIDKPILTVITTIGLDHTEILGDTIADIAYEKAGIIKEDVPLVFDGTNPLSCKVIEEIANNYNINYYKLINKNEVINLSENEFYYENQEVSDKNIDFLLKNGYYGCIRVSLGGIGDYQIKNSSLAIWAIKVLNIGVDDSTILRGIKLAKWPGRMELVMPGVYVDGAHNADGINEFVKTLKHFTNNKKILLFAAVIEKDYKQMIEYIGRNLQFDSIVVTSLNNKRAIPYETLQLEFEKYANCKV
ncbi:MAG: folylpolyglutamate synthase/dihydrofolate synthase family protein, partial [Lachnotalea sp.]